MFIKTLLFATCSLAIASHDDLQTRNSNRQEPKNWRKDPVCIAVYQGVLKGLKADSVGADIVENVVGKASSKSSRDVRMKRSFVLKCPLCEPTFEAFLAYQKSLTEKSKTGARNKPAKTGLSKKEIESLSSEETMVRLQGLAPVVGRWIQNEFESNKKLNDDEIAKWKERVGLRFNEGKQHLIGLTAKDKHYRTWSPYWGCAACNGARDAANRWKK